MSDVLSIGTISAADTAGAITAGALSSAVPAGNSAVTVALASQAAVGITIKPALSAGSLAVEGCENGTDWFPISAISPATSTGASTTGGATFVRANTATLTLVRVRALLGAAFGNGPIAVSVEASSTGSMDTTTDSGSGGGGTANQGTAAALSGAWPVKVTDGTSVLGTSGNPLQVTGPVPTGAATAANQTTGNTSLATLASHSPALGQTTMAGSVPVALASDQATIPVSSSPAADVVTSGTITTADSLVGGTGAALALGVLAGQAPTAGSSVTATLSGHGTASITLTPAVSAGALVIEVCEDGTNFRPAVSAPSTIWSVTTATMVRVDVGGFVKVRVRAVLGTTFTNGNISVSINATVREAGMFIASGTVELGGTDGTGIVQPTGGVGTRGWLSGIYSKVAGTLGFSVNAGTTDATTLRIITASDGPLNTNLGATTDAGVTTDVNATISAKLRGLVILAAARWPVLGQAVKAFSVPVTMASDQGALGTVALTAGAALVGQVELTDGTTVPSMLAGDSGQNAQMIAGARKEVSFTISANGSVATTDVSNYRLVGVSFSSFIAGTTTFQQSNDNSNWTAVLGYRTDSSAVNPNSTASVVNIVYAVPLSGRYFRITTTGFSSGTTAGICEFFTTPIFTPGSILSVTQSGTWTVQPGNTPNTSPWLVTQTASAAGGYSVNHIAGAATTTVKSGAGSLHTISINTKGAASTATVYDNTAGSGTVIAVIDLTLSQDSLIYDVAFATGLTIVTTGTLSDLTVAYK